jgi:hypothetical protein
MIERLLLLPTLLFILLLTVPIVGLPLGGRQQLVMTHQNIVMTLHGLMTHIDPVELVKGEVSRTR